MDIIDAFKENGFIFDENGMRALLSWLKIIPTKEKRLNWNEIQYLRGLIYKELDEKPDHMTVDILNSALEKLSELMVLGTYENL